MWRDQQSGKSDAQALLDAVDKSQARIEFDLNGNILDANENFLGAIGYSLSEVQGRHHGMFVEPSYAASVEYKQFWERLRSGQFVAGEFKRLAKNGSEIWIQAAYNPIFDSNGKVTKVVKFATDVTAAVEARRDAVKIKGVVDNAPNPTMLINPDDFTITYMNPIAVKTLEKLEQYLPDQGQPVDGRLY